ncbi:fumarylacetoacetate hydrolase family protein [Amycolatopsis sp. NPDC023774]|uniref:fumarylacetoacetate hydrolase family protein n=1 Tax=Amycolatopsis sp. NPDC023774 TaxID=3155015 RepID=UPI0033C8AC1B
MKLTTIRTSGGTRAARTEGDGTLVELPYPDVGALLLDPQWPLATGRQTHEAMFCDRAPLLAHPGKVVRVDLDRRSFHVTRPQSLAGPRDAIVLPQGSVAVRWKVEPAAVIGRRGTIAGFSILNEVTVPWLALGPALVTPDELPGGLRPRLALHSFVDGRPVQKTDTGDLDFAALVHRVSQRVRLEPGDVVAAGHEEVPLWLCEGSVLETEIDEIGFHENVLQRAT